MSPFVVNCRKNSRLAVMSQPVLYIESEIGERLRLARKNLGLNQSQMAELGGVKTNTQSRYEQGALPASDYLLRIGAAGADWYWIVTGNRIAGALSDDAAEIVSLFEGLPSFLRGVALATIKAMAASAAEANLAAGAHPDATEGRKVTGTIHEDKRTYRTG